MFAEARTDTSRNTMQPAAAERRFQRVASRVKPVAEQFCKAETATIENFDCKVRIEIDREMKVRNAYFTYVKDQPVIRMTMPILQDMQSDDEVAFVMGHEYGHLVGRHIEKQQQQAMAGALILGMLTAYSNAQAAAAGMHYDPNAVGRNIELGAAAGAMAYSQSYELESDTLGTRIARAAGYDPVKGARYFARPEKARTDSGNLSFWGTHPPDERRIATVLAVDAQIDAQQGLQRKQKAQ
ncbi:Peptidase family M48 [Lutimaribacter pacificus]|nr:Peptidase family M48 [Lutimaribacter pacificus]